MRRLVVVLTLLAVLLSATAAQAEGFGWGRFRDAWVIDHPFKRVVPQSEMNYEALSVGLTHEWQAYVRAYKRHVHRAWVEFAAQPQPKPESRSTGQPAPVTGSLPDLARSIWPSYTWGTLFCVIDRESNWDPHAYNPSGAAGLLQLMPIWYSGQWSFDPFNAYQNLYHGFLLYQMSGWGPWAGADYSCGI